MADQSIDLRKKLYQIKELHKGVSGLLFWKLDTTLVNLVKKLSSLRKEAIDHNDNQILREYQVLNQRLEDSLIYKIKGQKIEKIIELESEKKSLDEKLYEISDYVSSEKINTKDKFKKLKTYQSELNDLIYSYKLLKNKDKKREAKKLKPRLIESKKYFNYLCSTKSKLEFIIQKTSKMNPNIDYNIDNTMFHIFRMRRLGKYSRYINNNLLKYSDQLDNPDLRDLINRKNERLENLNQKVIAKVSDVRMTLDLILEYIAREFQSSSVIHLKKFLKQQKWELFKLRLKYTALGLSYSAEKARIITKKINNGLAYIDQDNYINKNTLYLPSQVSDYSIQ